MKSLFANGETMCAIGSRRIPGARSGMSITKWKLPRSKGKPVSNAGLQRALTIRLVQTPRDNWAPGRTCGNSFDRELSDGELVVRTIPMIGYCTYIQN